jgi:thiol-disulfide isomerase/thioredoxin
MCLALGAVLSLLAGVTLWLVTGSPAAALHTAGRAALFCGTAGLAAGLARLICRGEADRLMTRRLVRGDLAAILGIVGALLLSGYLTVEAPASSGPVVELAGPTLGGGRFDLAEQRGRVVLVDFWATWCQPCIAELPVLRALERQYRADGLRVVSVNLDEQRTNLERFQKKDPLPWPQIFFDGPTTRGWKQNPLRQQYEVTSIPFVLVVDREGRVAAKGVRGPDIEKAVRRALGKSESESGIEPVRWWIVGLFEAPWWLLAACCLGGVVLLALLEAALRFAFRRRPAAEV